MPPPSARCARHAEVPAVDVCPRCGSFVCGECVNIRAEDVYCPDCVPIVDRPQSKLALYALLFASSAPVLFLASVGTYHLMRGLLGFLALGLTPLTWAIAFALLLAERRHCRSGASPARGTLFPLAWAVLAAELVVAAGIALLGWGFPGA